MARESMGDVGSDFFDDLLSGSAAFGIPNRTADDQIFHAVQYGFSWGHSAALVVRRRIGHADPRRVKIHLRPPGVEFSGFFRR
ncbi:MAG TPA: hypothetical protein VMQ48_02485, partial [Candidatus Saccharimonadales bacterium]|nr:hypothetical protein [Candidatus Saccharimonadales bacterium]